MLMHHYLLMDLLMDLQKVPWMAPQMALQVVPWKDPQMDLQMDPIKFHKKTLA